MNIMLTRLTERIPQSVMDWYLRWQAALKWGFGIAMMHRLILTAWMALVWKIVGVDLLGLPYDRAPYGKGDITVLAPFEHWFFGIWRRWDTGHYMHLATHGYTLDRPDSTVFGPLIPALYAFLDLILPGPMDVAAMLVSIGSFGLALTFLYQLCSAESKTLARTAVILTAILPLSYFLSSPLSEVVYLASALGMVVAARAGRWGWVAVCGVLATLARTQGVILSLVAAVLLIASQPTGMPLRDRAIDAIRRGWSFVLIPLTAAVFELYRRSIGLPSLSESYAQYAYVFAVNPLEGVWINAGAIWHVISQTAITGQIYNGDLAISILNPDYLTMIAAPVLGILALRDPKHRQPGMVVYTWSHLFLFFGKMNWLYGTDIVTQSVSFGRYSLVLFPLVIFAADKSASLPRWARLCVVTLMLFGLALYSAAHVIGLGPP